MKPKKLSLEEHLEIADSLAVACHNLDKIYFKLQEKYGKSHFLTKRFAKLLSNSNSTLMCDIKGDLDTEYLKDLSDDDFNKHGFIYYNLDERYKKIGG